MPMSPEGSPEARIRMLQMMNAHSRSSSPSFDSRMARQRATDFPVQMPPPSQVSVPSAADYSAGLDAPPAPSRDMPTQDELDAAGQTVPTWTDPFSGELHYRKPKIEGSFVDFQSGQRMPRLTR